MISYPILAAVQSKIFDAIHVSTDSADIADVAGDGTFSSSSDQSVSDHVSMMECQKYVVKKYEDLGKKFDTVALLYATSPLMDPKDLPELACKAFEKNQSQSGNVSSSVVSCPLEHAYRIDKDLNLHPNQPKDLSKRTQDLPEAFYDAGMFAFIPLITLKIAKVQVTSQVLKDLEFLTKE